jgi:hypothetical protein
MGGLAFFVVRALEAYAAVGAIFALVFVSVGIGRVDPSAAAAGWGFRALVAPGCAALWPLLLSRWVRGRHAPEERNAHRLRARTDRP